MLHDPAWALLYFESPPHAEQLVVDEENCPAPQSEQEEDPDPDAYWPEGQEMQYPDPRPEYLPEGQLKHRLLVSQSPADVMPVHEPLFNCRDCTQGVVVYCPAEQVSHELPDK